MDAISNDINADLTGLGDVRANLSHDYFTTRQDRYHHLRRAPQLVNYLSSLLSVYSPFSYRLTPHPAFDQPLSAVSTGPIPYQLTWGERGYTPLTIGPLARDALRELQAEWSAKTGGSASSSAEDAVVWPVVQVGYLGMDEEERRIGEVFSAVGQMALEGRRERGEGEGESGNRSRPLVDLTSGYFGLAERYRRAILKSPADVRLVAASPKVRSSRSQDQLKLAQCTDCSLRSVKANGFYGSKGVSGLIPEGYTLLESQFERQVRALGRSWVDGTEEGEDGHGVEITEWEREGWTYHAKGLLLQTALWRRLSWLTSDPLHFHRHVQVSGSPLLPLLRRASL